MVVVFPLLQKKKGGKQPSIAILRVDEYAGSLTSIHVTGLVFKKNDIILGLKSCLLCWKSFHFLPLCPQQ